MIEKILYVGVDIGYGMTKGGECVFPSGVKKLPVKPPIEQRTVYSNGNYYSIGSPKMDIQESKFSNENTLILTEAVIAEALKGLGIKSAKIHLGVGLPLTRMGAEKTAYKDYMLKSKNHTFKYEGRTYTVEIISVDVFPQGYAGVVDRLDTFSDSTVVIDVGSWTIDVLPLSEGQPDLSRCKSLSLGTITAMQDINEMLRQKFGAEADETILKKVMIDGTAGIDAGYLQVIKDGLRLYVTDIMDNLRALKFNTVLTQYVFIGGGSSIVRNFLDEKPEKCLIIEDININAKGYENIMRHKYKEVC